MKNLLLLILVSVPGLCMSAPIPIVKVSEVCYGLRQDIYGKTTALVVHEEKNGEAHLSET